VLHSLCGKLAAAAAHTEALSSGYPHICSHLLKHTLTSHQLPKKHFPELLPAAAVAAAVAAAAVTPPPSRKRRKTGAMLSRQLKLGWLLRS
jgi:hypothetical protein